MVKSEYLMGPIQSFDEFLGLLNRRRLMIAAIVLFGAIISVMIGASRTKTYETAAVIQVEMPVISGTAPGMVPQSASLLQGIEQRLTTRENLAAMIDRHGLFADLPGLTLDQKIFALRSAVQFQSVASAAPASFGVPNAVSALIISTRFPDGDQAARVANDFAQGILDMSVAQQASRARDTVAFFVEEEARISQEIVALEAELVAYKNDNPVARSSGTADERVTIETEIRSLMQNILAVRGEKAALQAKDRLRETDRRRIEDLTAQEAVLQSQQEALQAQRDTLDAQGAQAPEVERTLSAYDRRLQQLQSQYELITARKAEAETALRLEQEQHAERFTLLERAIVPEYPTSGGGKKIAVAGTLASLVLALAIAFALDLMHPVLRSAAQMQRELDIRPVITIPDLALAHPPAEGALRRLWRRLSGHSPVQHN